MKHREKLFELIGIGETINTLLEYDLIIIIGILALLYILDTVIGVKYTEWKASRT